MAITVSKRNSKVRWVFRGGAKSKDRLQTIFGPDLPSGPIRIKLGRKNS